MNIFRNNLCSISIIILPSPKPKSWLCHWVRQWEIRVQITDIESQGIILPLNHHLFTLNPNLGKFNCLLSCFLTLMNMVQFQLKYIKELGRMTAFRDLILYKRLILKDVTKTNIIKRMPFNQRTISTTVYRYLRKDNGIGVSWALHVVCGELTSKERKNKDKPKRKNKQCQILPGSL